MSFGERRPSGFNAKSGSSFSAKSGSSFGAKSGFGASKPRRQKPRFIPRVAVDPDAEPVVLTDAQVAKSRQRAMNIALWHLEQSDKTRKELFDKLVRKEIRADIIETVLDRLEELNLIDDQKYAANFVRTRHEIRQQGASAIKFALRNKGVDPDLVAEALEAVDPDAEYENAVDLVTKKMRTTRQLDRIKRTNRLVGMLARKGYSAGVAFQVVRNALDAEPDED